MKGPGGKNDGLDESKKLGGGGFLKDGGRKYGEVREESLASCMEVVQIPTVKCIESEGDSFPIPTCSASATSSLSSANYSPLEGK